jgi:response regulator RpfG family c-di-GMP phosphodiesterase
MNPSVKPSETSAYPVLILDDEIAVLHSLRETLERAGYQVVTCASPLKALELVRDNRFSVILTDMRMPEMTGLEFLEHCEAMQPEATRVLITAVLSLSTVLESINSGRIYRFIPKPWLHEELLAAIENSVQRFMLLQRNKELTERVAQLEGELAATRDQAQAHTQAVKSLEGELAGAQKGGSDRRQRTLELCWRILNTYDPFLGGRARAIVELARQVSSSPYFSDKESRILQSAAFLCDLGLIGVSREALHQFRHDPDQLSGSDRALIRHHPVYSQTLAALLDEDPALAATIRSHHEHHDGTGYPDGIDGKHIPWTARCLAVIVAYVECEKPRDAACDYLLHESGHAFDPEAVRLFIKTTHSLPAPRSVREVLMEDLRPGMILSQGLYSPTGLLLVAEDQPLTPSTIEKIRSHNLAAPIGQRLLVYT